MSLVQGDADDQCHTTPSYSTGAEPVAADEADHTDDALEGISKLFETQPKPELIDHAEKQPLVPKIDPSEKRPKKRPDYDSDKLFRPRKLPDARDKLDLDTMKLTFKDSAEAHNATALRDTNTLQAVKPIKDDEETVANDAGIWVRKILKACLHAACEQTINEHERNRIKKMMSNYTMNCERHAWFLLWEVQRLQQDGVTIEGLPDIGQTPLHALKSSKRLELIIDIIKQHPKIAEDVLKGEHLAKIAACPEAIVQDKEGFKKSNDIKRDKFKKGKAALDRERQASSS